MDEPKLSRERGAIEPDLMRRGNKVAPIQIENGKSHSSRNDKIVKRKW
jgi:hypothetical protein